MSAFGGKADMMPSGSPTVANALSDGVRDTVDLADRDKAKAFREGSMRNWLVGLIVLLCTPAFPQQQPPVIAFDSVPDPLKLPDNLYLGEVSGIAVNSNGHIFVLSRSNTTGPAYAAAAAQLLNSMPMAISCVRSVATSMPGRS